MKHLLNPYLGAQWAKNCPERPAERSFPATVEDCRPQGGEALSHPCKNPASLNLPGKDNPLLDLALCSPRYPSSSILSCSSACLAEHLVVSNMTNQTPDSWEDELTRQTEGVNLNAQSRPQPQAPSFQPGAASFQPGAASFVPGQQFQPYGAFPQYGQYGQQPYGAFPQYGQQQGYGPYGAYNQQPGGFNQMYNQGYSGYQQPQQHFSQQPAQAAPAPAPAPAQSSPKPAEASTAAPKPKVLSIGGASTSNSAPKTKVLSIGTPTPASTTPSSESGSAGEAKGPAAVEAASKVTATKAIDKTEKKAEQKATSSGKSSPTPSGRNSPGRSSPSRGESAKDKRDANAVASEQVADVDEQTLKEIYGERKEHVNIVFIGHVDAGKSTLGGAILFCTGMVDERTLEKYKRDAKEAGRETWYLSWALDLTNEERAKGKTVEVGRAHFKIDVPAPDGVVERRFSILDAPGHKSYVHHMIGGASQADVGVLVISARRGEYETGFEKGGQTREHALLARNTGVQKLVVAVNKMDDPTVEWRQDRFKECTVKVSKFLEALGYKKADLTFMPMSAQRTLGVKDRVPSDVCPWYSGPSLIEYLREMKMPERNVNAPFMMPISAKYRDMGTMVEGRVEAGVIKKSQNCIIMPSRQKMEVAALYGETEDEIPTATCGDQVRMRLRGIEEEDLLPGFVMCSPKRPVHCVSAFEAKIRILDLKSILTAGFSCVIHLHSAVEEITIASLLHKLEPGTGRRSKRPPQFASKGQTIIARIEITSAAGAVCAERFEDYSQMGRFTLRDQVSLSRDLHRVANVLTSHRGKPLLLV